MTIQVAMMAVEADLELTASGVDNFCEWRDNSIDLLMDCGMSYADAENFVESL